MKNQIYIQYSLLVFIAALIGGCATTPPPPPKSPPPVTATSPTVPVTPTEKVPKLELVNWNTLPEWSDDNVALTLNALLQSCSALRRKTSWQQICESASRLNTASASALRDFFKASFTPYRVLNADGSDEGLMTGYYEPLLDGSRIQNNRYRHAVYSAPDDLLIVDLTEVYPQLKSMRLRGRLQGKRVVPYYDRTQIENGRAPLSGKEIVWVEDPVELFFLHIQGSGKIKLPSETIRVGYAEQNGHPYKAIGKWLAERGEMPIEKVSMQNIKAWAQQNPHRLKELLDYNPSYVFFRELPDSPGGPPGALGVPLTERRSIAVDSRLIPLGTPVLVDTTWPGSNEPLTQLMFAQDTGGAIKGGVRADFFWGTGKKAGELAGKMKQKTKLWVLLPNADAIEQTINQNSPQ